MSSSSKTKVADCILLDPFLFNNFQQIKYGIPFYKTDGEIFLLTKNDFQTKINEYKVQNFNIDEEDFDEKVFLINNYISWNSLDFKHFPKNAPNRAILDYILIEALIKNVSDIHFDLIDSLNYEIKFKIDTVLKKFCSLSREQGDAIIMRLKVLSSIDTSKKHIPHSSSFYRNFKNQDVDFRFSTHPTMLGERCVIRILQQKNVMPIDKIGLSDNVLEIAKKIIGAPFGFIVFTGPTNSGKTTTIHSILREIANSGVNIMTLEDPVEYRIPGIIQTNISEHGVDYFEGMKSILRQDPSVIFLGEIRDAKTAQIAVQAAMTGHKVLTTLHAYSIKGAINRLYDMGVSMSLLAESILAIFSQRLVRKSVNNGNEKYQGLALISDAFYFDDKTRDILRNKLIPDIPNNLLKIGKEMVKNGITTEEEIKRVIG